MHLFRCIGYKQWYLRDEFDPDATSSYGYFDAENGLVPEGQHEWQLLSVSGAGHSAAPLTVSLLRTEDEVGRETAKRRLEEQQLQAEAR